MTPYEIGERRHETCRYGVFSATAFCVGERGEETPECPPPLCALPLPEGLPPVLGRLWGGQIEFARDCAVCPAWSPIAAVGGAP